MSAHAQSQDRRIVMAGAARRLLSVVVSIFGCTYAVQEGPKIAVCKVAKGIVWPL